MIRTFRPSPPTVGVELEWHIVDRSTLDLAEGVVPLAGILSGDPCIKPEMLQTSVETISLPAESTAALRPALLDTVARLSDAAAHLGFALVGAGTHPFCERLVPVTPMPRYLAIERTQAYLAHGQITCSLQVHVGMPSGPVAMRVIEGVRGLLPVLLALSTSSPFFHGHATNFASYRQRVLAATRSCGVPPKFQDWPEFLRFLDTVERARMFASFRDMHWDLRTRPDFGTIEIRVMDAQPTVERSLAIAALVHSLLVHLARTEEPAARLVGPLPWWLERENAFQASHRGLEARIVCDEAGTARPLRRVAEDLFDLVAPTAHALGEVDDLARARRILEEGACAERELSVFRRTRSTKAVVLALANELLEEIGGPAIAAAGADGRPLERAG